MAHGALGADPRDGMNEEVPKDGVEVRLLTENVS